MENDPKSVWKISHRISRIKERERGLIEREAKERQINLQNEALKEEYFVKRDFCSREVQRVFSRNLLLLVIPIIISARYFFHINNMWLDNLVMLFMGYQFCLVINFIVCIFKSPENYRLFSLFHMYRVEKHYFILSVFILGLSCFGIYLYLKASLLIALLLNIVLFCLFSFILILYSCYIAPQKQ